MIKYAALAVVALSLTACLPGERLGNFKNMCADKGGKLEQTSPNNYKCTLRDGSVLRSN